MKHTGSRYKDYPSLKRRGLKPAVRQVAMIQTWRTVYGPNGEEPQRFTIELHGAVKAMVRRIMDPLRNTLYKDYSLEWEPMTDRLNGRCSRTLVLTIDDPDLHRLGVDEWVQLIKDSMERLFLCRVKVYDDCDKFLNA
jgi:hypothetical protein